MDIKVDGIKQALDMKTLKINSIFFYAKIRRFVRVVKIGKKKTIVVAEDGKMFKIKNNNYDSLDYKTFTG